MSANEIIWERYYINNEIKYIVTTKNVLREHYYLYEINEGKLQEIKKSSNPAAFHGIINK